MELKIKSTNVRELAADTKQREVFRYLSMESANIFFIQESVVKAKKGSGILSGAEKLYLHILPMPEG